MSGLLLSPGAGEVRFYIDLGTGSLVIQVLIASLAGALLLVKGFWKRILAFFKGIFSRDKGGDG